MSGGQKFLRFLIVTLVLVGLVVGGYFVAMKMGIIWDEEVDEELYGVRGIAVNEVNGVIDWTKVKKEGNISFAFIKATEGTAFRDENFSVNYVGAVKQGISVGVYHDFLYGSNAETQAKHYINTVRVKGAKLKPAVRFSFDPTILAEDQIETFKQDVFTMFETLEGNYKKAPMMYCTQEVYETVFSGSQFDLNNLVVENLKFKPLMMDASRWHFWQFSIDGTCPGISTPVCKLVYTGTPGDFENYMAHTK